MKRLLALSVTSMGRQLCATISLITLADGCPYRFLSPTDIGHNKGRSRKRLLLKDCYRFYKDIKRRKNESRAYFLDKIEGKTKREDAP